MSGLTAALSNALSGLLVSSGQSAVVSRNIARAGDENYTRKEAASIGAFDGTARLASITRNSEQRLLSSVLGTTSNEAGEGVVNAALSQLSQTIGDVEDDGSIAWGIGQLQQTLTAYEGNPASRTLATQAVQSAQGLVQSLNTASDMVQDVRRTADSGTAQSVSRINGLLQQFQDFNSKIVAGSQSSDMAELRDSRDAVLKQLSSELGIRTVSRPDNGMAIYTDSGITLFDVSPRSVTFVAQPNLTAGGTGNQVYIDGVQATGTGSPMPLRSGVLAAQVQVRDNYAVTYQAQLDEVARGLISSFAETDQSAVPSLPAAAGLFSYSGGPGIPPSGIVVPGLASDISLNAAFNPAAGGNPFLLRDGGANGAAYVANSQNLPGFQGRLQSLVNALDQPQGFAASTGLETGSSLKSFAAASAGWLEDKRSASSAALDKSQTYLQRANEALQRRSGVNLDEEMSTLLNLEKSYQASAKVMSTLNSMFQVLVGAVN